jgi:hypothetical protein
MWLDLLQHCREGMVDSGDCGKAGGGGSPLKWGGSEESEFDAAS